jgi:hypothetical protein
LIQFVNFCIRGHNILDLVLSDDDQIISHITCDPPIGYNDHCTIKLLITIENGGHSHCTDVIENAKTAITTGIKLTLMQLEDTWTVQNGTL